ncbi:MAG: fatty acid--CoA ligase family protein [Oceanipulchritudo sp.]
MSDPMTALINHAGDPLTWESLAEAVSGPFQPVVTSDDAIAVAIGLLQAIHHEGTVTLADAGAELETEGLEGKTAQAGGKARAPLTDRADIMTLLDGPSRGQIRFLTSGTTGPRKQVIHGLATLLRGVRRHPSLAQARWGSGYHPAHMAGVQVLLQALATGCPVVQLFGLEREPLRQRLHDHRITHLSATPSFYRFLLPTLKGREFPDISQVTLGGEAFDPQLAAALREAFPAARIRNIYASTEAGSLFVADGDAFLVGEALEGSVKIEQGELWLARDLLGDWDGTPAWYATGDWVEIVDPAPLRFRFVGRSTTGINVGGYTVHPETVEAALCGHPAIAGARVFGRPQALVGNLLMAELVAEPGMTPPGEAAIRKFLTRTCQPFEIPRILRFVDSLDQTPSGKIRR